MYFSLGIKLCMSIMDVIDFLIDKALSIAVRINSRIFNCS